MSKYRYTEINRLFGKALHRYDMISDGDKIAVGLSGGKDSLTLMWFLNERLHRIPIDYELYGIYVDPGFEDSYSKELEEYCRKSGYNLIVEHTENGPLAHSSENRENPCFLCSRLRRKRLFEIADELGCRKLALGHHKDDIIETLFMNILYAGEISTMVPAQSMFNNLFTIIRPLAYVDESIIKSFVKDLDFPVFENNCPSADNSKRKYVKSLLEGLYKTNSKIKGNIFRAMSHVNTDYLLK